MFAKINGRDFEFTANETILDVARRNDIHIPTLCELHDIDHAPGDDNPPERYPVGVPADSESVEVAR